MQRVIYIYINVKHRKRLLPETLCTLTIHTQALSYFFARITTFASAAGVSEAACSEVAFSGAAFSGAAFGSAAGDFSGAAFGSAAGAAFVLPS